VLIYVTTSGDLDYDITVQYYLYRYRTKHRPQGKEYIDCKGCLVWRKTAGSMHTGKLKERMPNIAGNIWYRSESEQSAGCRVGVECFPTV
jgi:hypothetical protein